MSTGLLSVNQQYITVPFLSHSYLHFDVSLRLELSIQCIFYNLETTHSDRTQIHLAKYSVLIFLCSYFFVVVMKHTTIACTVTPVLNVRDHFHQHISWRSMSLRITMLCSA